MPCIRLVNDNYSNTCNMEAVTFEIKTSSGITITYHDMIILSFKGAMQSHDVGMGVGEHVTEDSKHTTPTHNHPYISSLAGSGLYVWSRETTSGADLVEIVARHRRSCPPLV